MNGTFDAAACNGATLADLSPDKIRRFVGAARGRGFPLPENASHQDVLDQLRLAQQGRPSHAAVLLFGNDPQRFLPSSGIRCTHYDGTDARSPIEAQDTCKGTLFETIDHAVYFVLSKIDGGLPTAAVREAIVNAVAHRDYSLSAGVLVSLFSDRLEVWNVGALPPGLSLESLRRAHESLPANPLLAQPLYLTTHRAGIGTGTCDMIASCRQAGLPAPEFRLEDRGFLVILRLKPQPAPSPDEDETPGQDAPPAPPPATGEGKAGRGIAGDIVAALEGAPDGLTIAEIAARIGLNKNNIRRSLNALVADGEVTKISAYSTDPNTRYKLAKYA